MQLVLVVMWYGYETVADMRGIALRLIGSHESILYQPACVAEFNHSKCVMCGNCLKTCFYAALSVVDGTMHTYREMCDGCGLGVQICGFDAVQLVEK